MIPQKTRLAYKTHLVAIIREDIIAGLVDSVVGDLTAGIGVDAVDGVVRVVVAETGEVDHVGTGGDYASVVVAAGVVGLGDLFIGAGQVSGGGEGVGGEEEGGEGEESGGEGNEHFGGWIGRGGGWWELGVGESGYDVMIWIEEGNENE
ncbi:hypothetical protein BPAE_0109g00060 [Botrytis paeoniae]|uniref:Uncharacterized protein n=1 Tax=Botrytis paeoniae TaxID=278948 RepID=A0A4Z1FLB0_9HELO|nr:hypothetical protein BPAE_0109g00060 [Botrytis paeoniae]